MNKTKICRFKAHGNISWDQFYLWSARFFKEWNEKHFIDGTVYDFSVDYSPIEREDILNIYEYLIKKNKIKQCLD